MLDLTDLKTLLAVIDEGGITAAARKLHLSPSAMSDRVRGIEQRAGFTLLNRHSRGSEPTVAATQIAQEARTLVQQSERLQGLIHAWRVRAQGELILHVNSNAIASFLPDILARFLQTNPAVRVQVRESMSEEIARNVRSGEADIGIAASNVDLTGLRTYPFQHDNLVLLVHREHTFAKCRSIDFAKTLDEPYVGLDSGAAIQIYIQKQAMLIGKKLTLRATLRSFDGVIKMVAAGAGIAIVPASVATSRDSNLEARIIRLNDDWATRDLVICTQDRHPLPDLTDRLFRTLLTSASTDHHVLNPHC